MSLNSYSSNASLHSSNPSTAFYDLLYSCMNSAVGVFNVTTLTIPKIFLLGPLYIFVLYLGHQRWRRQRSGTTMSHADVFTYNMVISELLSILGFIFCCFGVHTDCPEMTMLGIYLFVFNFAVQMLFHIVTCVERYLAVVHPVTYLGLKKAKWIRFRNITIGCVWLLGLAMMGVIAAEDYIFITIIACLTFIIITTVSFCSLSVLCVLIRSGPGEGGGGGDRQRVDQSKLRAFQTIMAILGVLVLRFGWDMLMTALYHSLQLGENEQCGLLLMSDFWISLPSSLVLPVLFLHRSGKLPCFKNSNTTGQ